MIHNDSLHIISCISLDELEFSDWLSFHKVLMMLDTIEQPANKFYSIDLFLTPHNLCLHSQPNAPIYLQDIGRLLDQLTGAHNEPLYQTDKQVKQVGRGCLSLMVLSTSLSGKIDTDYTVRSVCTKKLNLV